MIQNFRTYELAKKFYTDCQGITLREPLKNQFDRAVLSRACFQSQFRLQIASSGCNFVSESRQNPHSPQRGCSGFGATRFLVSPRICNFRFETDFENTPYYSQLS